MAAHACRVTKSSSRDRCSPSQPLPNPTAPDDTNTTCRPSFISAAIDRTIGATRSAQNSPSSPVTMAVPTFTTTPPRRAQLLPLRLHGFALHFS